MLPSTKSDVYDQKKYRLGPDLLNNLVLHILIDKLRYPYLLLQGVISPLPCSYPCLPLLDFGRLYPITNTA
jgi:hypothetical protein